MDTCYQERWDCLQYAVDNKCPEWEKYAENYARHLRWWEENAEYYAKHIRSRRDEILL